MKLRMYLTISSNYQQLIMEKFMSKKSTNQTVPVFKVCFFPAKSPSLKTNSSPLKMVVSNRNLLSGRGNGHPIVGQLLNQGPDWFRAFAIKCSIRRYPVRDFVSSNGAANGTLYRLTRWWFQAFFIFTPTWGDDPT